MEKVSGIGGMFFRANPQSLSEWYHQHLGITPVPTEYDNLRGNRRRGRRFRAVPQLTQNTSAGSRRRG